MTLTKTIIMLIINYIKLSRMAREETEKLYQNILHKRLEGEGVMIYQDKIAKKYPNIC